MWVKLINNRLYLDYNATAPLAESVLNWFCSGALYFGNPNSIHTSGKRSRKLINETTTYLKSFFNLKSHEIFYHSGGTEGANSFIKSFCFLYKKLNTPFHIVVFKTDHSCIFNQKQHVELFGGSFHILDVDSNGEIRKEDVLGYISKLEGAIFLNYTFVNNETGVIWPIENAVYIKKNASVFIHVDAVQMIGKVAPIHHLNNEIDAYTFSGHKFGAMKGVGFSFVLNPFLSFSPLLLGGGQQNNLRSGTENIHGIYSLKLAIEEYLEKYDGDLLKKEKDKFENLVEKNFSTQIKIVSQKAKYRNFNTSCLIVKEIKIDTLLTSFDMAEIDLSSGSACSSGAVTPSRILLAQGYSDKDAKSAIRISFPLIIENGFSDFVFEKFKNIISPFF